MVASLPTFGVFAVGKGVGNVLAGPISAAMLLPLTDVGTYGALRYKAVSIKILLGISYSRAIIRQLSSMRCVEI